MNDYPTLIKERLTTIINEMAASPELFVKNPEKDFTRERKLPFETVVQLLLSMGGNSLYNELLEYSGYDVNTATTSAFVQQSDKILPVALGFILNEFTNSYEGLKRHKGWEYLIRVKDIGSNGIVSSLNLPNEGEFDVCINLTLTRKQPKDVKAHPEIYKVMPNNSTFDFLDLHENKFYPISFRVVRFKISEDTSETIITNLERSEFYSEEIKELYHMRWGIETYFRELKYAIGLTSFHAKKTDYITQEVFAKLIMYNFFEMITLNVVIKQKPAKHGYQANFTVAIQICRFFFRCRDDVSPPDIEAFIQRNILPVRKGRKDSRKIRPKSTVSFIYRVT